MNSLFQLVEYIELARTKLPSTRTVTTISKSKNYFIFRDINHIELYRHNERKPVLSVGHQWLSCTMNRLIYPEQYIPQEEYQTAKEMDEFQLILTYGKSVTIDKEILEDIRLYVEDLL